MSRKLLINIHLYLAAFLAPVIIITAVSGGLYLLGYKGNVEETSIYKGPSLEFNASAKDMKVEIVNLLKMHNVDAEFEYVKGGRNVFFTRPTSKENYVILLKQDQVEIIKQTPDLIKTIVELHKGHGPLAFKTFQKLLAVGLIFIIISGLWMGLSSPKLRNKSLISSLLGGFIFLILAFV
jgi:hypothetical protein